MIMRRGYLMVLTGLVLGFLGLAQQCTVEVIPPNPTSTDDILLRIQGQWGTTCPKVTYSTFVFGNFVSVTGRITNREEMCFPSVTPWTITVSLGRLAPGTYWVSVNIQDGLGGPYGCRWQGSFVVQPGFIPPVPPYLPPVDYTAQLQAMLNRGPEYFAIAKQANAALSSEEKEALAREIQGILARGQAFLGGEAPFAVRAWIPPELDDNLRALAQNLTSQVTQALGGERIAALGLLRPVYEVPLQPPHTHWTCYWSYVYAWWTWIYAYWTYVCYDTPLAYWTMVYAYYSLCYAYYCYLQC